MSDPIKFYFDFLSPYSYLAWTQRENLQKQTGRLIDMTPVDILPLMEAVGNSPTTIVCKAKGKYARSDLERWVKRYDVPFERHPGYGTFMATPFHLAVLAAAERGQKDEMVAAGFNGMWRDQVDMTSEDTIVSYLTSAGVRDAAVIWSEKDKSGPSLKANADAAVADGVFGAPSLVVDGRLYFGNDRLNFLIEEVA